MKKSELAQAVCLSGTAPTRISASDSCFQRCSVVPVYPIDKRTSPGDMHAAETAVSGLQNVLNYITKHSTALIQLMDERSKMLSLEDQERIFEEEQKRHKNNGYSWLTE